MFSSLMKVLTVGLVLTMSGEQTIAAPDVEEAAVASLAAEGTSTDEAWRCGACIPCDFNRTMAAAAPFGEYTLAVCQLGMGCNFPICLEFDDDQQQEELALSVEDLGRISDYVLSGAPTAAVDMLARLPDRVQFVESRNSIQLLGCTGAIVANLPLTAAQVYAVRSAQAQQ